MHSDIIVLKVAGEDDPEVDADDVFEQVRGLGPGIDYVDVIKEVPIMRHRAEYFLELLTGSYGYADPGQYPYSFIARKDGAENYFKSRYNAFKDAASKITLAEFSSSKTGGFAALKSTLDDGNGFFIWLDGDAYSLDSFVRLSYIYSGTEFVISDVIDYHA